MYSRTAVNRLLSSTLLSSRGDGSAKVVGSHKAEGLCYLTCSDYVIEYSTQGFGFCFAILYCHIVGHWHFIASYVGFIVYVVVNNYIYMSFVVYSRVATVVACLKPGDFEGKCKVATSWHVCLKSDLLMCGGGGWSWLIYWLICWFIELLVYWFIGLYIYWIIDLLNINYMLGWCQARVYYQPEIGYEVG